eukprot:TRINITY_DN14813_c0_g1_i1.p1 TRINITY_DN14813_c0_g1~~TRINITY_DN14813_c0_g1_i1.p1  ORF type:complete len:326 (+),score=2.89 TRINITY_DN14813_c0_g1_i1:66-1043(+)
MKPSRTLELPYRLTECNRMDWSVSDILAVGFPDGARLYSTSDLKLAKHWYGSDVSSVSWSQDGNHLAAGYVSGDIEILEMATGKVSRLFAKHDSRVGMLSWNGNLLATASYRNYIHVRDIRTRGSPIATYSSNQRLHSVRWSHDGRLLACGGDINGIVIWDHGSRKTLAKLHKDQRNVKALDWSPHNHHILASAGGARERTIKIWNIHSLKEVKSFDTGISVYDLKYYGNALISTHGYLGPGIIVWNAANMRKIITIDDPGSRILHFVKSPTKEEFVTVSEGSSTLKVWEFPINKHDCIQIKLDTCLVCLWVQASTSYFLQYHDD